MNLYQKKDYLAAGYRKGSIVRVRVKNFLTYDECEVFPGPKLNVVIGPNGSGKSTLTHAICLACCGSTGDIGRANDLAKFVKRGKTEEEAFTEVDILEENGSVVTVRRTINGQNNTSKWTINGVHRQLADAKKIMERFNIDVDNLCSFMPQDKVGKFTQYSPKEVLQNTLKSIKSQNKKSDEENNSSGDLYAEQEALSNSQALKESLKKTKEAKLTQKEHLQKQLDSLQLELDRLKQKDKAKERKRFCEIKLLKVKGGEQKKLVNEMKAAVEQVTNQLMTYQDKIAPYEMSLREYKKEESKIVRQEQQILQTTSECNKNIHHHQQDLLSIDEDKDRFSVELANYEILHRKNQEEYEANQEKLKKLKQEKIQAERKLEKLEQEYQQLQINRQQLQEQQYSTREIITKLEEEQDNLINELKSINSQLNSLQEPRELFKKKLANRPYQERIFNDTLQAMNYLEKHEEEFHRSGQLKGEILGPVALYINTNNDPAVASMLEQIIPINRLLGFLVTNDQDGLFLKNLFRTKLRLQIDIFTIKSIMNKPQLPYSRDYCAQLTQAIPGFRGYLYEQITCNEIVLSFLFSFQQLHTIVWARGKGISNMITSEKLSLLCPQGMPGFRLFVHDEGGAGGSSSTSRSTPSRSDPSNRMGNIIEHSGRKSRYAPNAPPSTSSSHLQPKGILNDDGGSSGQSSHNPQEIREQLTEQKQNLTNRLQEVKQLLARERDQENKITTELTHNKSQVSDLNRAKSAPAAIERQITTLTKTIEEQARRLTKEVYLKEKKKKQKDFALTLDSFIDTIDHMTSAIQQFSSKRLEKRIVTVLKSHAQEKYHFIEQEMNFMKREIFDLKRQKELKEREYSHMKTELDTITNEMTALIESYGGYETFISDIFPQVVAECPENTIEEIEDKILQIEMTIKNIIDNPQVVERYNSLDQELQEVTEEYEKAEKEYNHAEISLAERSEKWKNDVISITGKLNNLFSIYMKGLKFDGEIILREVGRFCDYELQLRVSFRENTPLSDLSGARHSGGERAVSTIMFLMALQRMTSSPFRVVDEINQGMDERNERLVFDRIVKSVCGDKEPTTTSSSSSSSSSYQHDLEIEGVVPQYFLVTPKLLQGLRCLDHDQVTVLLIWNGPGIEEKWNLSNIVENLKRKRKSLGQGKVEEDDVKMEPIDEQEEEDLEEIAVRGKPKMLRAK